MHGMRVLFMIFAVYKNLKSSFSEENMLVHALDVFIKKRHHNGLNYPIKHKKLGSNFKVAPKFCTFLYNAMETLVSVK